MPDTDTEEVVLPTEVTDYISDLEKANKDLGEKLTEVLAKADEDEDEDEGTDPEVESALAKADPAVLALIEKQQVILDEVTKRADTAEQVAKSERDARLTREFISKASEYVGVPTVEPSTFGLFLKSAAEKLDEQEFGMLTQLLDATSELAKSSKVFEEAGSTGGAPVGDLERAAAKLMADDPTINKFEAIAKAVDLDPALWNKES